MGRGKNEIQLNLTKSSSTQGALATVNLIITAFEAITRITETNEINQDDFNTCLDLLLSALNASKRLKLLADTPDQAMTVAELDRTLQSVLYHLRLDASRSAAKLRSETAGIKEVSALARGLATLIRENR